MNKNEEEDEVRIHDIYRIFCKNTEVMDCYIGRTTNFESRMSAHKSKCATSDLKLYKKIREEGGWNNWTMQKLHSVECISFKEANDEELRFVGIYKPSLNIQTGSSRKVTITSSVRKVKKNKIASDDDINCLDCGIRSKNRRCESCFKQAQIRCKKETIEFYDDIINLLKHTNMVASDIYSTISFVSDKYKTYPLAIISQIRKATSHEDKNYIVNEICNFHKITTKSFMNLLHSITVK